MCYSCFFFAPATLRASSSVLQAVPRPTGVGGIRAAAATTLPPRYRPPAPNHQAEAAFGAPPIRPPGAAIQAAPGGSPREEFAAENKERGAGETKSPVRFVLQCSRARDSLANAREPGTALMPRA